MFRFDFVVIQPYTQLCLKVLTCCMKKPLAAQDSSQKAQCRHRG